jgi:hypothetical protein
MDPSLDGLISLPEIRLIATDLPAEYLSVI